MDNNSHVLPAIALYGYEIAGWCLNVEMGSGEYASYYVSFQHNGVVECDMVLIDCYGNPV